jgi:hypothetical protein
LPRSQQAFANENQSAIGSHIDPSQLNWLQSKFNSFLAAMGKAQREGGADLQASSISKQANLFGLRGQSIIIPNKKGTGTFLLGDSLLPLSAPTVSDVLVQTEFFIKNGELVIQHKPQLLTQRITGFDFVSYKHDGQFLFLLNKDGRVFAINNRFLKKFLFQSPVPIFQVGNIRTQDGLEKAKLEVILEEKGPTQLDRDFENEIYPKEGQKLAFYKGDIFVELNGVTVDVLDRAELLDNYMASSKYLALLCYQNNPRFYETENELRGILDQYSELLEKMQSLIEKLKMQESVRSESTFRVLSSLSPYALQELLPYLHQLHDSLKNGSQRKRILFEKFIAH